MGHWIDPERTKVVQSKFKNKKMFTVIKNGEEKPVLNMGIKKAKLALKHMSELEKFVNEYDND